MLQYDTVFLATRLGRFFSAVFVADGVEEEEEMLAPFVALLLLGKGIVNFILAAVKVVGDLLPQPSSGAIKEHWY